MKYSAADMFRNTIAKHAHAMSHNTIAQKSAETAKNGFATRNASGYLDTTTSINAAQLLAPQLARQITAAQVAPAQQGLTKVHRTKVTTTTKVETTKVDLIIKDKDVFLTVLLHKQHLHKHLFSSNREVQSLARARPKSRAFAF